MRLLRNAFELYINSSVHVSLAVVAFCIISILEADLEIDLNLLLFVFFASITGYNFVKYAGIAKLHHSSLAQNLRFIQVFSMLCIIALIYFSLQQSLEVLVASGILGLLTILYALPVFAGKRNLRSMVGLKIFVISTVWAGTSVILPVLSEERALGMEILVNFLQRLMLVILLTLPFEIRDLDYDDESLGTIPQKLGIGKTRIFGTILAFLIFIIELVQGNFELAPLLALSAALLLGLYYLWRASRDQSRYYASFWVEAVPIMYLGIYWVLKYSGEHIPGL